MIFSEHRVLVVGYVWPEPNSSAAGSHLLSLMMLFAQQGAKVVFASAAALSEHRFMLSEVGIEEVQINLNCSSFDTFINDLQPTIVLFDRFMLEEQFGWRVAQQCPQALRILDTEDLHFLRHGRHQAHKQNRPFDDNDLHSDMALREIASIYRSDLSLIISDAEMHLLMTQLNVPQALLNWCPFLLPQAEESRIDGDFENRRDFISIGNFRHAPNWDSVLYLKQTLWPAIRQQLPDAVLHIAGAYPPKKATDLHDPKTGFLVDGWIQDAEKAMGSARVCLAPLRFGAGIKGKLTLAMQSGTPSVTTPVGAEGINGDLPWPGAIAHSSADFVDAAVSLYRDGTLWHQAQQKGAHILQQRFNKEHIAQNLLARLQQILSDLKGHRQRNFVGQMLQHHQHRSTQYMSQWIEAKNRIPSDQ